MGAARGGDPRGAAQGLARGASFPHSPPLHTALVPHSPLLSTPFHTFHLSTQVLGVEARATDAELKKAYRQLCLTWHPDKHASSTEDQRERARHRFARIQVRSPAPRCPSLCFKPTADLPRFARIQTAYEKLSASMRSSAARSSNFADDFFRRNGRA